jgi:organic radical activating enzyme
MSKLTLPFVEMMTTQFCNISCTGCTNYSDLLHKGFLTWQQAEQEIAPWLQRVTIPDFGIFGGEPLTNPDIRAWILGVRKLLPDAQIRFTTNGLLLEKNFDIVELLEQVGNCVFKIAVHKHDAALERVIQCIFDKYDWQPVTEFGVNRYRTDNGFRFHLSRPKIFWKTFKNDYNNMEPHNSNPKQAFEICCQKTCPLLYNGKIYKCSTSGLLKDVLKRYSYPNREKWEAYLIDGLAPDCSESELSAFLDNFGQTASMCAMCPTKHDVKSQIIHLDNVSNIKKT